MTLTDAIDRINRELEGARETERANREAGSPAQSVAYDAGRYAGLKEALEILDQVRHVS